MPGGGAAAAGIDGFETEPGAPGTPGDGAAAAGMDGVEGGRGAPGTPGDGAAAAGMDGFETDRAPAAGVDGPNLDPSRPRGCGGVDGEVGDPPGRTAPGTPDVGAAGGVASPPEPAGGRGLDGHAAAAARVGPMRGSVLRGGVLAAEVAGAEGLVGLRGPGSPVPVGAALGAPDEEDVRGGADGALPCAAGGVPGRQAGMVLVGMRSGGRFWAGGAALLSGDGMPGDVVGPAAGDGGLAGDVGARPGPDSAGLVPERAAGGGCGTGVSTGGLAWKAGPGRGMGVSIGIC
jgi:hypothetical protein